MNIRLIVDRGPWTEWMRIHSIENCKTKIVEGPNLSCTQLGDSRSMSYCEFPIVSRVSNRASSHTLYSQYVDFRLFFGSSVCVICQKQKNKNILFLTKILSFFCPEQISWQNSIVLSMFCFFCHEIYYKISCSTTFVLCCSEKETERTHLPCNVLWLFWRRWFRYCFLGHHYWFPSAIGEACAPWVLFEDILYADWKVLIWYLAAANFFASNGKEYQ